MYKSDLLSLQYLQKHVLQEENLLFAYSNGEARVYDLLTLELLSQENRMTKLPLEEAVSISSQRQGSGYIIRILLTDGFVELRLIRQTEETSSPGAGELNHRWMLQLKKAEILDL